MEKQKLIYVESKAQFSPSEVSDKAIVFIKDTKEIWTHGVYFSCSGAWATPITLSLTGDTTGSVSIDGSGNASIATRTTYLSGTADIKDANNAANNAANTQRHKIAYYVNIHRDASNLFPASSDANGILSLDVYNYSFTHQLGFSSDGNIYHRRKHRGTWETTWKTILNSSNYTNFPHTFASLTNKPTTLSGYGITDCIPIINGGKVTTNTDLSTLGMTTTGAKLSVSCGNDGHPSWLTLYSNLLMFRGAYNTYSGISTDHSNGNVTFIGGRNEEATANNAPNWWFRIRGVSGTTYNLNSIQNSINNLDSVYLKKSGGTMTGVITLTSGSSSANEKTALSFIKSSDKSEQARIGTNITNGLGMYANGTIYIRPNVTLGNSSTNGLVISNSLFTYNGNAVLTSNNYTNYTINYANSNRTTSGYAGIINSDKLYYNSQLSFAKFSPHDNRGEVSYELIAELPDYGTGTHTSYIVYGISGFMWSIRDGSCQNSSAYPITAIVSIGPHTYSKIRVPVTTHVLIPFIVKYNDKYYIALRKTSASTHFYFMGIKLNLLTTTIMVDDASLIEEIKGPEDETSTAKYYYNNETPKEYLHAGNYSSYAIKVDGTNGTSNGVSALLNKLTTGTDTPVDADYYICQSAGGGTTTTTYHRRPMSAMYAYIKSKATSDFLPLSGGILGSSAASNTELFIKSSTANLRLMAYSDSTNYIQSGNSTFDGSATLKITGYYSNTGTNLYFNFANIYCRAGNYTNIDSGNYSSYALPLSGGTMTGTINCKAIVPITDNGYSIGTSSKTLYEIHANFFKRRGSSNDYVLLGGGGHKLISDFVQNYTAVVPGGSAGDNDSWTLILNNNYSTGWYGPCTMFYIRSRNFGCGILCFYHYWNTEQTSGYYDNSVWFFGAEHSAYSGTMGGTGRDINNFLKVYIDKDNDNLKIYYNKYNNQGMQIQELQFSQYQAGTLYPKGQIRASHFITNGAVTDLPITSSTFVNIPIQTAKNHTEDIKTTRSVYASAFYENSDIRLKENVHSIDQVDLLKNVDLVQFNFKNNQNKKYGVIAQQLEQVGLQNLVYEHNGNKAVDYISLLVLEIQRLRNEIGELKQEINKKS